MIGDGERRAGSGVEKLVPQLFAHRQQSVLPQCPIDVHGPRDVADAVLGEDDDRGPAFFVEPDEIRAQLVHLADVGQRARVARADTLQVVVEVRQIDQRQRRMALLLDDLRRFRDPPGGGDRRPRPPEIEQREGAQPGLQLFAQASRHAVDVGQLASVGGIHGPGRDADVSRGVHVEPPEQVRAGEGRILGARDVPDLRPEHEAVRLTPETDLAILAHVPAVADDAVSVGPGAGQIVGLRRAGDGGERGFHGNRHCVASPSCDRGRATRNQVARQADDIENDRLLHCLFGAVSRRRRP